MLVVPKVPCTTPATLLIITAPIPPLSSQFLTLSWKEILPRSIIQILPLAPELVASAVPISNVEPETLPVFSIAAEEKPTLSADSPATVAPSEGYVDNTFKPPAVASTQLVLAALHEGN